MPSGPLMTPLDGTEAPRTGNDLRRGVRSSHARDIGRWFDDRAGSPSITDGG